MKYLIFIFCFTSFNVFGQIPTLDVNKRVFDFENIINNDNQLQDYIYKIEKQTGSVILVLTTDNFFGEQSAVEANLKVGKQNKVGKGYNGIIILVSKNQRRTEISVEQRFEGILPDAILTRICKTARTDFQSGNFDKGVTTIIVELVKIISSQSVQSEIQNSKTIVESDVKPFDFGWLWDILAFIVVTLLGYFGWNTYENKKKEKAEKLLQEQKELDWALHREQNRLTLIAQQEKQVKSWEKYKTETSNTVNIFLDKLDNITLKLRESNKDKFTLPEDYFKNWYDQVSKLSRLLNSDNYNNQLECESLIKQLYSYSFEGTNSYLNTEYSRLQNKKLAVKSNYVSAKNNLVGSKYDTTDLKESILNSIDNSTDLFKSILTCDSLLSTYDKIIRWQDIQKQEEIRIEQNRLAEIRHKEEQIRQAVIDEENRINRKKRQQEEDDERSRNSYSSSYSSNSSSSYSSSSDSSSSFSSDSGGSFSGGSGGDSW